MKKVFTIFTILFLFSSPIFSQWYPQYSGTQERLLSSCFINEDYGWIAGNNGTILKTTDGGVTWIKKIVPLSQDLNTYSICFVDSLVGWAVLELATLSERYGRIIHTTDGGVNWEVQYEIDGVVLHQMDIIDEIIYVAGTSGIVLRSSDGGNNWLINQISGEWNRGVFFVNASIGWISNDLGEIYKTTNGGNTWYYVSKPSEQYIMELLFLNENVGWAVGANGFIAKTTDGGLNWNTLPSGSSERLNSIKMINYNLGYVAGYNGTILKTTNGGVEWAAQITDTFEDFFTISVSNQSQGWAAGTNGTILSSENLVVPVELISFTGVQINNHVKLNWETATELNNLGFEIQRSYDKKSWEKIIFIEGEGSSSELNYYSFIDYPTHVGQINYRLEQKDLNGSSKIYEPIEIDFGRELNYSLSQNYPNPFNPETIIKFSVPEEEQVKITVMNGLGQIVKVLANRIFTTGQHEITFYAGSLSSGVYFYIIEAGIFKESKKMILLK